MIKKSSFLNRFFKPELNGWFWIRIAVIAVLCVTVFGFFLQPCVISGESMMPTYGSFGVTFCIKDKNAGFKADYGDIVMIRYQPKTMYLKRIVGKPGDVIEFISGKLYRNGSEVYEPYVTLPCTWNIPAETVGENMLYAVGDNRSMPWGNHRMGQVDMERIAGRPLW